MTSTHQLVDVDGRTVRLTSLDRVLFPAVRYTKRDLIDYYARAAPALLPHVAGRPITLHRFPEGVDGPSFFQTRAPAHPSWIRVQRMHTFRPDKEVDTVVLDDTAGLVWAANLSSIELHPYLAMAERLDEPTDLVFDLDPGSPATIVDACAIALEVRDLLSAIGLRCYPKVTGGAGVHVLVPLVAGQSFDDTKATAHNVARVLTAAAPDRVTDLMPRRHREGKVFIDWSQNDPGKSTIAPYSVRAGIVPTVAMPVEWPAIEAVVQTGDPRPLLFKPDRALHEIGACVAAGEPLRTDRQVLPLATRTSDAAS